MSYIKIWLHFVWTTKNRIHFLDDEIRNEIIYHIKEYSSLKSIHLDHINGYYDHLHALISLNQNQNTSDIMKLIKGESSFWINKNKLTKMKFEWQDDYYAVSVGISQIARVRKYIQNQVYHHLKITLQRELNYLMDNTFKRNQV